LMMSLWDALRMNMMISYQELVRTFPSSGASILASKNTSLPFSLLCITPPVNVKTKLARQNDMKCYLAHIL
ncbi:hypothetical protein, partial [Klebsiella pneumoniae]